MNDKIDKTAVELDLGACIGCGLCTQVCSTGTIVENLSTQTARRHREDLILSTDKTAGTASQDETHVPVAFKRSVHARVVTTGCSACDLEIGASTNPVFDLERLGVHIVASPRAADVMMVTGPVGKGMRNAVRRCYDAMPDPRIIIAVGSCAISGGVHKGGYADTDGLAKILPVDVYVPGCPPHPWSVIHGVLTARGTAPNNALFVPKEAAVPVS